MAHYQLATLDLSTRIDLAVQMLNPERQWGEVTRLARTYGTSRKFLYGLRDQAIEAIQASLVPQAPGPKAIAAWLRIDEHFLRRAIVTLSMLPPSLRNLQLILEVLFGQHCSLGHVQQILQVAGERARAENQTVCPVQPILGEVDEIYKTRRPCLTVVDGRSMLVLNLARQADCDRTTWGVTLLDLEQRGVRFADLALDGSQNIRAGIRDAELACDLRPDLFHLFQEGREISYKLKWSAQQALAIAQRAQKAEQEAQLGKRFRGRPREKPITISASQAQLEAVQAQQRYELWLWLFQELRQALQWTNRQGCLKDLDQARQDLELILEWMQDFPARRVPAFAHNLVSLLDELLAPLAACVQRLAAWRNNLSPDWEAFILWTWKHRQALDVQIEQDFPPALRPVAQAFWEVLADLHRSSSLAEALHSWLRPFLELHRSMPDWLLALLQAFWNHHTFLRGKRRGQSPLALAGAEQPQHLAQWIEQLLSDTPANLVLSSSVFKVQEKCYPISVYL